MKKIGLFLVILVFGLVYAYTQPVIKVVDPWVRAVPPTMKNSALFMTIINDGDEDDELIEVKGDISKMIQIHRTVNENGVMKMVHVEKIEIPAHSKVELKPGGYHVMLMGLKRPLKEGEKIKFTLVFKKSGEIQIEAPVRKM
ncbi:MAG: copper chaperone PCu(A)C [Aquificae bacterium]|nr:copper chaperone PCu(A)C [Aquificota bacterium]